MTGSVREWIKAASRSGLVCQDYMRKIAAAERKSEMFRVLCDTNGGRWLFEQHAKGILLPLDDFAAEYAAFLGGKHVVDYGGYSSKMYCRLDDAEITADTTLVYVLECRNVTITVPKNAYPTIVVSAGSSATIDVREAYKANVETYGVDDIRIIGDATKVKGQRYGRT